MAFCKEFNASPEDQNGMILPVVITVYSDKSFTFILKSPPASVLLQEGRQHRERFAKPNQDKVGKVTKKQLLEIYNIKKADLNAKNPEAGIKVITGAATTWASRSSTNFVRTKTNSPRESPRTFAPARMINAY